jgi:hypothetical protein
VSWRGKGGTWARRDCTTGVKEKERGGMDGVVDVDVDGDGTGARTVRDQRGDRGAVDWTLHSRMAGAWVSLV